MEWPRQSDLDRVATATAMPSDLQEEIFSIEPEPFEVVRVDRAAVAEVAAEQELEPYIPEWVDVRAKPTSAQKLSKYRPRVRLGDKEVDPLVVLGSDERRTYNTTAYPWGCICKVIAGGFTGSGIIVGPRHVLTASHVVNWNAPGGVSGSVEVHRNGGAVRAITRIVRVHAFTRVTGSVGWFELDEDYAVLTTASPIGSAFGYLGVKTYNSSWDGDSYWANVGYPGDVGSAMVPTRQWSKWLDEHSFDLGSGRAMDTNADINPGNSGGPMFAWWSNGPYVVAVVSAHDPGDNENYCSGGRDLTRLVSVARSA